MATDYQNLSEITKLKWNRKTWALSPTGPFPLCAHSIFFGLITPLCMFYLGFIFWQGYRCQKGLYRPVTYQFPYLGYFGILSDDKMPVVVLSKLHTCTHTHAQTHTHTLSLLSLCWSTSMQWRPAWLAGGRAGGGRGREVVQCKTKKIFKKLQHLPCRRSHCRASPPCSCSRRGTGSQAPLTNHDAAVQHCDW